MSCSGATNAGAAIQRVQFAQTVLLETTHPFFYLSAMRDTGMRVSVTGSGAAPEVRVTGTVNGKALGTVCLRGPATLASAVDETAPNPATSFTGNLPAAWVLPGLQLQLQAGAASRTIAASALRIGPAPVLSFVTSDWLLWGDTQPTPLPATFGREYAAREPFSYIDYSPFPVALSLTRLPIPPRSDALSGSGATVSSPALVADRAPSCSNAQAAAGTCVAWSGFSVLEAVRSLTEQLQVANGLSTATHWYGALGLRSRVGGGLGAPAAGAGDDYSLFFNHEFGHAFGQPHWGDSLYSRAASGDTQVHPYTGQITRADGQPYGGGFGNSWAFDPLQSNPFVNPVCAITGQERQEPMQRSEETCVPSGEAYDFASDYSALFVARFFNGATDVYSGQVASPRDLLGHANVPFSFPTEDGRDAFIRNAAGAAPTFRHWNSTSAGYADQPQGTLRAQVTYAQQWDTPVYTLWGSFSNSNPEASTILAPLKYRGGLPRVVDPTNATDFAAIKANTDLYWWGADLVVRADFSDGTHRNALVRTDVRGTDPLDGSSFSYWAANIPVVANAKLTSVTLYYRPMESRYSDNGSTSSSYYVKTNLNSTLNASLTADHYLDSAKVARTLSISGGL